MDGVARLGRNTCLSGGFSLGPRPRLREDRLFAGAATKRSPGFWFSERRGALSDSPECRWDRSERPLIRRFAPPSPLASFGARLLQDVLVDALRLSTLQTRETPCRYPSQAPVCA